MSERERVFSPANFELKFIAGLGEHSEIRIDKAELLVRYLLATMARNPLPAPAPDIIRAVRERANELGLGGDAIITMALNESDGIYRNERQNWPATARILRAVER